MSDYSARLGAEHGLFCLFFNFLVANNTVVHGDGFG